MTRLFSINIFYHQQLYTALVSMRQQGHDFCCQVRYIDKALYHILPGDKLVFSLSEGLKEPTDIPKQLTEELVKNTNKAITEYLRKSSSLFIYTSTTRALHLQGSLLKLLVVK